MAESVSHNPNKSIRSLGNSVQIAIDIGGSLIKLAYNSTHQHAVNDHPNKAMCNLEISSDTDEISEQVARLHFITYEIAEIETCLEFIKNHLVNRETKVIKATGGGALTFKDLIEKTLGLKVDIKDEMVCLVKGCNFVLKNVPQAVFTSTQHPDFQTAWPDVFPYILVNVGSCVSMVKVESEEKLKHIGGSLIGGRTFCGLGALFTKTKSFDELLQLASKGEHRNVDMLVKDIYPGLYEGLELTGDQTACSFGKSTPANKGFSEEDLAKSLLHMICSVSGQLGCLYARLHNVSRVFFGGGFISEHPGTTDPISGITYRVSKGEVQALFIRNAAYLGVIGAFLSEDDKKPEM